MSSRAATTDLREAPRRLRLPVPVAALVEAATLLALMAGLNLLAFPDDPGFVSISPHPVLVITLLLTVRYGFATGVMAASLSTVVYVILLAGLTDLPSWQHLAEAPWSTPIALLVPMTIGVGMLVQRHLTQLAAAEAARELLARENARLELEQAELRDVNVQLAGKVVGAGGSLQALYEYAKDLNVTDVDQIYAGLTRLLEEVLQASAVAVWTVAPGGALTLATRRGAGEVPPPPRVSPRLAASFDARGVLSLHDLPADLRPTTFPYLVGRIHEGRGGRLLAYLCVERLPFARYNAEAIRVFSLIVDWASGSIGNALQPRAAATPARAVPTPPPARAIEPTPTLRTQLPPSMDPTPTLVPSLTPTPTPATPTPPPPLAPTLVELRPPPDDLGKTIRRAPRSPSQGLADLFDEDTEDETRHGAAGHLARPRSDSSLSKLLDDVAGYLDATEKRGKGRP